MGRNKRKRRNGFNLLTHLSVPVVKSEPGKYNRLLVRNVMEIVHFLSGEIFKLTKVPFQK